LFYFNQPQEKILVYLYRPKNRESAMTFGYLRCRTQKV